MSRVYARFAIAISFFYIRIAAARLIIETSRNCNTLRKWKKKKSYSSMNLIFEPSRAAKRDISPLRRADLASFRILNLLDLISSAIRLCQTIINNGMTTAFKDAIGSLLLHCMRVYERKGKNREANNGRTCVDTIYLRHLQYEFIFIIELKTLEVCFRGCYSGANKIFHCYCLLSYKNVLTWRVWRM